jgi:hypothetical protein
MEEQMGLGWCDNDVFRIFKPRLLGVMGVKLNTLNVNLHDLHFVQLHGDKNGWTRWRRDGFTRRNYQVVLPRADPSLPALDGNGIFGEADVHILPKEPVIDRPLLNVAHMDEEQARTLETLCISEWSTICNSVEVISVSTDFFVSTAAQRYRQPNQPFQNAFDVLRAIIAPQDAIDVKYWDFFRFMAQFGPPETVMLKIHSILEVTATGHPWLYFGLVPGNEEQMSWAAFDPREVNCLVIYNGRGNTDTVWNLPLVLFGDEFLIDKDGRRYSSWQAYFQDHPARDAGAFVEMEEFR